MRMTRNRPGRLPGTASTAFGIGVLIFLVLPIFIVVPMSFSSSQFLAFPPPALSLRWYAEYAASPGWMLATAVSLQTAIATCLIATPLGVAAAYGIHSRPGRWARAAYTVLMMPLMVPHIIIAIGIFFIYARIGANNSVPGLILAHAMLAIPFVLITTLSGLQGFDMTQERAAQSLGVNRFRAFLTVTAPQIKGSIVAGMLFAFISSLDEVVVSLFVSGGPSSTLPKRMFVALRDEIDPTIAAISSMLIVASLAIGLSGVVASRARPRGRPAEP
jgi:putative spermidine/putrescine transport system permease protein